MCEECRILIIRRQIYFPLGMSAELVIKSFLGGDGAAVPDMTEKFGNATKGTGWKAFKDAITAMCRKRQWWKHILWTGICWWKIMRVSWNSGWANAGRRFSSRYRAEKFMEYTKDAKLLKEMDTDLMQKRWMISSCLRIEHGEWYFWMDLRLSVEVKKHKKRGWLGCESSDPPFSYPFSDSKKKLHVVKYEL